MSFELICPGCGASSGPSVGVCPFCKTVLASVDGAESGHEGSVATIYESGKLDMALTLAKKLYETDEKLKKDVSFLLLYAKILIDTEGPTSLVRSVLAEAHLYAPSNQEVLDYLEVMEARQYLKKGLNDNGEVRLKKLLRRSPQNVHAHFFLGTHLFWVDEQMEMAIPHLETCVRLSPNFLRAWGCLGAIYKKMGHSQLAERAFQKCLDLEPETKMREYLTREIESLK